MTNATPSGKPDAGNSLVRFDEREIAPTKPKRGGLLCKSVAFFVVLTLVSSAHAVAYKAPQKMAYRSFLPELEETARFADMGIPLRTVFIANTVSANGVPYCQYPIVWKQFGEYDFNPVDQQLGDIIRASPKAEFMLMLDLNTPIWMNRRLHYDSFNEITHVLSIPKYREEARDYLDKLVHYIEKGYGNRVKGYILMCGRTSEWFERDLRQSHVKNLAWRAWCARRGLKYGKSTPSESALASGAFENVIYDPATEQEKIDFWKFHSWIISDGVLDLTKVVKEASGGKPTGASFGYYMICDQDACGVGNLDYERVIAAPWFDMITSPATYTGREIGGGTGSMLVTGTSRRYGKRFYYSIDFWPHSLAVQGEGVTTFRRRFFKTTYFKTLADTIAGNTRNAAYAIIQHADFHWFDQWGDFYKDPGMHERIAKLAKIQKRFEMDSSDPYADILVVADPDSAYARIDRRMAAYEPDGAKCPDGFMPALGCGEEFRNRINRLGVVHDIYSFNDLPHVDLSRFKAVILSDVWTISPEKAKVLRDYVLKDGRTAVWVYAPGISDGKSLDVRRIRAWSGADFKTPGVTTTAMDGWTSVYAYDYRALTPEKLAGVLKAAGCHFWTDAPTPVMANEHVLSVHVKEGGRRTIRLPRPCAKVVDLLTDRVVATDCTSFEDDFATPDTKIYETVYEGKKPTVTFDDKPVHVEEMTVSAIPFNRYWPGYQRPKDQTKTAYFVAFDTTRGGQLTVDGVTRVIDGVGKYTFEVNGGATELHVFADPPWTYRKTANEIYFGPGEHFPGVIAPEDGQTVVLDRGAVVHGTIFVYRKRGVKIVGRGILDLSDLKRADRNSKIYKYVESLGLPPNEMSDKESDPAMSCTAIVAYGARDLTIEGITIRDSPRWTVQVRNGCRGVTIDNVKILGSWRYNNDGFDLCTSSEINIRNSFVRTYDDAFVVRAPFLTGEREDCRDILVEDCVTWNDWGVSMGIAHQYRSSTMAGITFRRIRVERPSSCVATVHVTMGNTNCVTRDILFEDIDINNFPGNWAQEVQVRDDQPFTRKRPERLLLATVGSRRLGRWVTNQKIVSDWPDDWYRFDFDNIVFRNFRVSGEWSEPRATFFTRVPRHTVKNLLVEGFPANAKVTQEGNVERLPVPAADRNAYDLAGFGKVAFRLDLGKDCFPTPVRAVRARDMRAFSATTDDAGVVTLVWKGHPLCGDNFTVTGTCAPAKDGYRFALATSGDASGYKLQGVSFPVDFKNKY